MCGAGLPHPFPCRTCRTQVFLVVNRIVLQASSREMTIDELWAQIVSMAHQAIPRTAHGALPHRAPSNRYRCTSDPMRHVWHQAIPRGLKAFLARKSRSETMMGVIRLWRMLEAPRRWLATTASGLIIQHMLATIGPRPLLEEGKIGLADLKLFLTTKLASIVRRRPRTWCTATPCTPPSVHC